jgi:UV DNA damage endonuclease
MSIGFDGIALGVKETDFINWSEENSSEEKRKEIISHNLKSLENILDYSVNNHIGFYCLDSKLIPFDSNLQIDLPWWEIFKSEFQKMGEKISDAKIRISMDLGKSSMPNSTNEVMSSDMVKGLEYHAKIFKALNLGIEHKIIIQLGDVDNGKKEGLEKFKKIFNGLDKASQQRLALMNDERHYNIQEIISLGETLDLPVVFHNRNHETNPSALKKSEQEWISDCKRTWKESDGDQILYYTEMNSGKPVDSIAETIGIKSFLDFYEKIDSTLDIMLEVKDRNLSAVKCINSIQEQKDIKLLELEWRKYKYSVLENSHRAYLQIRSLLKEKDKYPVVPFYTIIEEALAGKKREGFVNAAQHVWGYFKKCATENEKRDFLMMMEGYKAGKTNIEEIKKSLWDLSVKYEIKYLLESYYFIL